MENKPVVGILGGMGPAATANFLRLFVREMNITGATDDRDFPRMVMLGLPLDDWGTLGATDKSSVARQVRNGVRWLIDAGAQLIAIPCNSVHESYYEYCRMGVPVLNIIDETIARTQGPAGVLCSRQTRDAGLYEGRGVTVFYPDDQCSIDIAIAEVISGRSASVEEISVDLFRQGAHSIVLGCTELSLCTSIAGSIDSAACLAQALAARL